MKVYEFLAKREKEVEWFHLNGYADNDPDRNGEYRIIEHFCSLFDLFIDIGANAGCFSKKVLNLKPDVNIIAFEPNPSFRQELICSLGKRAVVHSVALSDRECEAQFHIHPGYSEASSLFQRSEMMPRFNNAMQSIPIQVYSLEKYYQEIMDKSQGLGCFLKIDTEGLELSIMQGGKNVLNMDIPMIMIFEYSFGWKESSKTLKEGFHFLDNLGFSIYRIIPFGIEQIRFFTSDMENHYYCNYLAIKNLELENVFPSKSRIATRHGYSSFYPLRRYVAELSPLGHWSQVKDLPDLST